MTTSRTSKRIVLTTFGSFGDVHPYMALALELNARGHTSVIATIPGYREKIEAAGILFHPIRPDIPSPDDPVTEELLEKIMNPSIGAEFLFRELILPHLRESYEDLSEAVRGADLFVTHPITFAGHLLAQKLNIPWVSTVLSPVSLWSVHDPCIPPNAKWLGGVLRAIGPGLNRGFLNLVKRLTRSWFKPLEKMRAELGLPPGLSPVFEGQYSPQLVLALFSRVLAEPQADWPPHTHITGFPFYDKRDETPISPDLLRFLDQGPPPIVFTLGSSAVFIAGQFFQESIAAAKILGQRAVLLIGDARNLPREPLPENIVAFDYAPYGELLPRASVIVHQGGVGTTGQALRAGKPMLVMPYNHDQPDNAARIARLGVGRSLPRNRYRAARVSAELKQLLTDTNYVTKAAEVGQRIRQEDGARAACDRLEELL